MKEAKVFKSKKVELRPFVPHSFTGNEDYSSSIELLEALRAKSSKRMISKMAEERGVSFDKEKIRFAKKVINMILDDISNGK